MRPSVLVFSGLDPSGGAGIAADIGAIGAQGAHALPVVTALTVQDHNRVYEVEPVDAGIILRQALVLADACAISAVKIGIPGNRSNAAAIAHAVGRLRLDDPGLPVVLDPVLASGHGDPLAHGDALLALEPLLDLATLVVPNLPEARRLGGKVWGEMLVTGGHGDGPRVVNRWQGGARTRAWEWPRLDGSFHGSGCTLAAAIAGRLALGETMEQAIDAAQAWCQRTLAAAYSIGPGQRIPARVIRPE